VAQIAQSADLPLHHEMPQGEACILHQGFAHLSLRRKGLAVHAGGIECDERIERRFQCLPQAAKRRRPFPGKFVLQESDAVFYPIVHCCDIIPQQREREKRSMLGAKSYSALILVFAGSITAAWAQTNPSETLKVAIPQRGAWDAGVAELGQRGGIFQKHGLNLEILYVQAGPESIQAVIGGSMDIATAAGVSAAVGTFAKGAPIRIIGSEMIGAPDLYWYVPANSPIRGIEDLNGKTIAYSLTGSSSHAALLALIAQYKLTAKPTSTGNIAATITQTMTGQVDVGFGAAPFGLDLVEQGKVRIIATGNDVASLRTRTVRVNVTSVSDLENRREAIVRFNRAYRETVDWMYSAPAALTHYAEYSHLPETIVHRVRDLIPKQSLVTDRIEGIDQIMADAVSGKFIPAPLTSEQVKQLVQIP
jgi:NitT/TauT family transport system substrate-binding protein